MDPLNECINNLYKIITDEIPTDDETLIKMHTKYLEELGDVSFPVPMKNWYHLVRKPSENEADTIFNYKLKEDDVDLALQRIIAQLSPFSAKIRTYKVIKTSVHLFLERPLLFSYGIRRVLADGDKFGKWLLFSKCIRLDTETIRDVEEADLTTLRQHILKCTIENLLELTANTESKEIIFINLSQNAKSSPNILCGPVVNDKGVKDVTHKAADFFDKRISDMRLMAQHRYRVNIKSASEWNNFFARLGKASVTIEMLSNKPHKSIKITLNDLSGANKGPAFIFYNCARLSILLKEFDNKVAKGMYPSLPELEKIDFSILNQPEEWELLFVCILQFPYVIKNCVRSVDKGNVNPQHLITFLSNLSSVFSVYYRRVRILTDPRDHMFGIIHSRVYLLKALQVVFHNALRILNIEPIKEM